MRCFLLRYLTAGESHGKALLGILEGMPAGVVVSQTDFRELLEKRKAGYGRGKRMLIEPDQAQVLSGIRFGRTIGSPIGILIQNNDFENWRDQMDPWKQNSGNWRPNLVPRPGHADFAGTTKYLSPDIANIRERASARETAIRVALSVPPRALLKELNVRSVAFVKQVGKSSYKVPSDGGIENLMQKVEKTGSEFLTVDENIIKSWKAIIDNAKNKNETLGGIVEIRFEGLPPGLGSHVHWDRRLDSRLSAVLMGIPGIKALEIGEGISQSQMKGSEAHDKMFFKKGWGIFRKTNRAGGIEGGISNGEPLIIRCFMKPLPGNTLGSSPEMGTGKMRPLPHSRSDTIALVPLAIIAESVVAIELASSFLEKFGGDSIKEIKSNLKNFYQSQSSHFSTR